MKPIPRDQFIRLQSDALEKIFALTEDEDKERQRFLQMSIEADDWLAAAGGRSHIFKITPDSASYFTKRPLKNAPGLGNLLQHWERWKSDYPQLLKRNPKLETHDLISWISETHIFAGWPDPALEEAIQDWLDRESLFPLPFDDRLDIITPGFYEKFCNLRRRIKGWLHYDENRRQVVFSPEVEWQAIRGERRAAYLKRIQTIQGAKR